MQGTYSSVWRGLGLALALALGCAPPEPPLPKNDSINLMILKADRILGPIQARIPRFQNKTGIKVNVKGVTLLDEIFAASQSPNHGVDVVIGLNVWVGDFVNTGFIEQLDPYIDRDKAKNDPELDWKSILKGVDDKNRWGGHYYSLICDNDNMFLTYRKDILSASANQQGFLDKYKYPLPNPPQTLDQLVDVAAYFDQRDWDGDGAAEHGFVMSRTPKQLMYWYALAVTTPYTVMDVDVAKSHTSEMTPMGLPNGLFMFKPDMTPLVTTPGFKAGIAKWLQLAGYTSPTADRQAAIDQIVKGEALMAIDWGDTGPASLSASSAVKGKLGFAKAPGTHEYYDWVTEQMVHTDDVHYAPLQSANGFAFYMTSTSENKEAVWKFIKFMNSPEISTGIVTDARGGYQPWRTTHNEVGPWVDTGWGEADAANYIQTILDSTNHPNASLDLRIPGIFDYGDALESHLVRLLELGPSSIDAEMEACAADLAKVTEANQIAAQQAAYRAHLGLPQ
jgi:multiple sugar transport system substrate-binding protein